jgi:branched-subunit amino acid aminotransferase/4-amino-4-deoxychorismate lyase
MCCLADRCLYPLTKCSPRRDEGGGGGGLAVQTAPVEGHVLPGVIRRALHEACVLLGVPFIEEAPRLAEAARWRDAFVTNCVRRLQPVGEAAVLDRDTGALVQTVTLPAERSPLYLQLRAALEGG